MEWSVCYAVQFCNTISHHLFWFTFHELTGFSYSLSSFSNSNIHICPRSAWPRLPPRLRQSCARASSAWGSSAASCRQWLHSAWTDGLPAAVALFPVAMRIHATADPAAPDLDVPPDVSAPPPVRAVRMSGKEFTGDKVMLENLFNMMNTFCGFSALCMRGNVYIGIWDRSIHHRFTWLSRDFEKDSLQPYKKEWTHPYHLHNFMAWMQAAKRDTIQCRLLRFSPTLFCIIWRIRLKTSGW